MLEPAAEIEDGLFVGAEGEGANELSRWTTLTPDAAEIGPGETVPAIVKIAVPHDAAHGEQLGVVWAEVRSGRSGGGVAQVSRVGIRLYLSVGPGGAPAADFTVEALTPARSAHGEPVVTATVATPGAERSISQERSR